MLAENPETGEVAYKTVLETYENETDELVHVYVNDEEIVTTPSHPFYAPKLGWTKAINLRAGDILVLSNGEYVVVEFIQHEILESPVKVYNFEVEDFHTYFVGHNSVLVHNACGIPTIESGEFNEWFDSRSYDEFMELWNDPKTRATIKRRLRYPGGMHEWHMVARTDQFKYWGVSAETIISQRTPISEVKFVNPSGWHGGFNSTTFHNELAGIIDTSIDYDMYVRRLNNLASYRLEGGIDALPPGLRLG